MTESLVNGKLNPYSPEQGKPVRGFGGRPCHNRRINHHVCVSPPDVSPVQPAFYPQRYCSLQTPGLCLAFQSDIPLRLEALACFSDTWWSCIKIYYSSPTKGHILVPKFPYHYHRLRTSCEVITWNHKTDFFQYLHFPVNTVHTYYPVVAWTPCLAYDHFR